MEHAPLRKKRDSVKLDLQLEMKSLIFTEYSDEKSSSLMYRVVVEYTSE